MTGNQFDDNFFATGRQSKIDTPRVSPARKVNRVVETQHYPEKSTEEPNEQKGRIYPERTFDQQERKVISANSKDLRELEDLCFMIKEAKRSLPPSQRETKRITSNFVIMYLIETFTDKLREARELNENFADFSQIQSEDQVRNFVAEMLKF